jgi:uncharacterized protein (TIGR00251 family)
LTTGEWLRETPDGVSLSIKVIPRAGVTQIAGTREGRLLIRLAAAPVDGAANDALIGFLSALLRLPAKTIHVASGMRSRNKVVKVRGVPAVRVLRAISLPGEPA